MTDASIDLKCDLCLQSRVNKQLLLDPTEDEAYREDGSLMLAMMPTNNLVGHPALHCATTVFAGTQSVAVASTDQVSEIIRGLMSWL